MDETRGTTRRPGLCSVTLRGLPPAGVIDVAVRSGLAAIEWGGDVHVPPGDVAVAREVAARTAEAGLAVASYGSYLRLGGGADPAPVLAAATALGAPRIRVWAGVHGSAQAGAAERAAVVAEGRELAARAADHGMEIGLEFHGRTLTDTVGSTLDLLDAVGRPDVLGTYWQPPQDATDEQALAGLEAVLPRTVAVHAFSWWPADRRHPLAARRALWAGAARLLRAAPRDLDVLLEFVVDDEPDLVAADAAELRSVLDGAGADQGVAGA